MENNIKNTSKTKKTKHNTQYQVVGNEILAPADKTLIYTISFLCAIGIMFIFSASIPTCMEKHQFVFMYVIQHIFWLGLGLILMLLFSNYDYKKLKKWTLLLPILVIIALLLVKFTPLGVSINGSRRWLTLGFFQFQPSEVSKIAMIMLLASAFSLKKKEYFRYFPHFAIPILTMLCVVYKQPNLSMTIILLGIMVCMYICSGKSLKILYVVLVMFACLIGLFKVHVLDIHNYLEPYQIERLKNALHPERDIQGGGYQVFHSLIAISSGGIMGAGYGASKEKLGYIPEAHNDFIFAIIAEEMGFFGSLLIIGLFWTLLHRGLIIAFRCPDLYGRLLAAGISISIAMQGFFNIAVASARLPATGITLPFISYGGSSLLVTMCMVGILLNISKKRVKRIGNKNA